jgi:hypothetical protein
LPAADGKLVIPAQAGLQLFDLLRDAASEAKVAGKPASAKPKRARKPRPDSSPERPHVSYSKTSFGGMRRRGTQPSRQSADRSRPEWDTLDAWLRAKT